MQKVKVLEMKTSIKNYYIKRALLEFGLRTFFPAENPRKELCGKLKLLPHEKRGGKNSVIYIQKMVAINDEFLQYKCITPTQHKK